VPGDYTRVAHLCESQRIHATKQPKIPSGERASKLVFRIQTHHVAYVVCYLICDPECAQLLDDPEFAAVIVELAGMWPAKKADILAAIRRIRSEG
jgi:hypothetical protein